MKKLLLPLALLASTLVHACINAESRRLKDGTLLYEDSTIAGRSLPVGHHILPANFEPVARSLQREFDRTHDYAYLSDIGVLLVYQGRYAEARDLYRRIEREKPGRYATASNLGTVYELMGRNDSALYWIRRAVAINPASHNGSEFIHVHILEAKVAGSSNPSSRELTGTDFGSGPLPVQAGGMPRYELAAALFFQLNERMTFIRNEDPIVARLLFDYGNIAFLERDSGLAREAYEAAGRYGFRDPLLARRTQAPTAGSASASAIPAADTMQAGVAAAQSRHRFGLLWVVAAGFVLLAVFVGLLFQRRVRD
ncbi:tetratricopeptide repeat protein [Flaviaesturariibacter terrae]